MRWAWRDAIRFRDWQKLQEFAKTEPCGQLADTLYELSIGLDDREDVRAAKKVLYLLAQQGYEPSQTAGPRLTKYEAATAGKFGVLSTTDWQGMQYVALVHTCGRKVRVLSGWVNHCGGYCRLESFEFPFGHLHRLRGKIMLEGAKDRKAFVVSPEYMLNRLAWYRDNFGLVDKETHKREWVAPPYWNKLFDERPARFDNLVEGLASASLSAVDPIAYWREHPWAKHWRIPICNNLYPELMSELRHIEAKIHDREERYQRRLAFLNAQRDVVVKDFFSFDYEMRFLDLATLAMIEGDELTAQRCKRCFVELAQNGASSRFFDSLIEATARDLDQIAAKDLIDEKHFLFGSAGVA